jgi:hypothetical protein
LLLFINNHSIFSSSLTCRTDYHAELLPFGTTVQVGVAKQRTQVYFGLPATHRHAGRKISVRWLSLLVLVLVLVLVCWYAGMLVCWYAGMLLLPLLLLLPGVLVLRCRCRMCVSE